MTTLSDIKTAFGQYFVIKDKWAIDIILATIIGNQVIERDPLWLMMIGASSGGKTTLLAPCHTIPHVHFLDDLTEKTLLSGYKIKGKEASFLKKVGSGMLCFSDFTSILSKGKDQRGEILTQLKLVYDGKLTKETGTGSISWTGKIGAICASTPDVYTYLENSRSMGERFLYYWLEQPSNQEIMDKQAEHKMSARDITEELQALYAEYFINVKDYQDKHQVELKLSKEQRARVQAAAVFCVNGKATIRTDFKTGQPNAIPNISGVGRDNKIFDTLLHSLQVMDAYEHDNPGYGLQDDRIEVVEKCAYSSINRERRKILEILVQNGGQMTTSQIGAAEGLGLEKDMVMQYLAPLHSVGMIKKSTASGAHKWTIEDPKVFDFVERVSKTVVDTSPVKAISAVEDGEDLLEEYFKSGGEIEEEDDLPIDKTIDEE